MGKSSSILLISLAVLCVCFYAAYSLDFASAQVEESSVTDGMKTVTKLAGGGRGGGGIRGGRGSSSGGRTIPPLVGSRGVGGGENERKHSGASTRISFSFSKIVATCCLAAILVACI